MYVIINKCVTRRDIMLALLNCKNSNVRTSCHNEFHSDISYRYKIENLLEFKQIES